MAEPKTVEEGREKATGLREDTHYHISRLQIMRKNTLQWKVQSLVGVDLHVLTLHHNSADGNDRASASTDAGH